MVPDDGKDLPVVAVLARAHHGVWHSRGSLTGGNFALGKDRCIARLQGHIHQEPRVSWMAQPDRVPVTIPMRYLGEVVITQVMPELVHKRHQIRRFRRSRHDDQSVTLPQQDEPGRPLRPRPGQDQGALS